jgi:hypothetical protein
MGLTLRFRSPFGGHSSMKPTAYFFFVWLGTAAQMNGQTPASPALTPAPVPVLSGPLLNRAPEYSGWVITVNTLGPESASAEIPPLENSKAKPPKGAAKTPQRPVDKPSPDMVITVAKTRDVLSLEFTDKHGAKSREWHKGKAQVITRPEWQTPLLSLAGDPSDVSYTDYSSGEFPTLRWISKKNFVGIEQKAGRVCLAFKDTLFLDEDGRELTVSSQSKPVGAASRTPEKKPEMMPVAAYIDYYSRLPVFSSRGLQTSSYRFVEPPMMMQALPPEIQSLINAREATLKDQLHAPAKP